MPISFGFFPVHVWLCTFPLKLRLGFSVVLQCCSKSAQMKSPPPASVGLDSEQGRVFLGILPYMYNRTSLELQCVL